MQDRPSSLARKPKPARDEHVDPMDYRSAAEPPKLQAVPEEPQQQLPQQEAQPPAPAAEPEFAPATEEPQVAQQHQPQQQVAQQVAPSPAPVAQSPAPAPQQAPAPSSYPGGYKPMPGPGRRRGEPTIPISPRISVPAFQLLDAAISNEQITQREAIEQAIFARWGHYGQS